MTSVVLSDRDTLQRTIQLINFLARVTDAANRNPVRDIGAPSSSHTVMWLDDLPSDVDLRLDADAEDAIMTVRPVRRVAPPPLPVDLTGRVSADTITDVDREPRLDTRPTDDSDTPDAEEAVQRSFARWLSAWQVWAEEERPRRRHQQVYDRLEAAAKTMEQRDDANECVIATGLVCWLSSDGTALRRHLLTELVRPAIDRQTAEVRVMRVGGRRRMEDSEIFDGQACYLPDRGRGQRDTILISEDPFDDDSVHQSLRDWLGLSVAVPAVSAASRPDGSAALPLTLQLSLSPAFIVRPRSQALVAEAYRRIAEELDKDGATVPVGLAQLVVDTERAQRSAWLAGQGALRGDLLGDDPLFPLPANTEQQRVMELLRTETGVVVQGPPGTGKTHTIANLVSALLARGQRVLVTSQKDQALKVLRDKIPDELRHLCVLLAGGSRGAAAELRNGLDAFSAAHASADRRKLQADSRQLAVDRDVLRRQVAAVNDEVARLREIENHINAPVVPGFTTVLYCGPLTQIVRDVQRLAPTYDWMPELVDGAPDLPPLDHAAFHELLDLLRLPSSDLEVRAGQEIPGSEQLPSPGAFAELLDELHHAETVVQQQCSELATLLSRFGAPGLDHLEHLGCQARRLLTGCGLSSTGTPEQALPWVVRAIGDRLNGKHSGLWGHLRAVRHEPRALQERLQSHGVQFVVEIPMIDQSNLGVAKGWLNAGRALLDHVRAGGKIRNRIQKKVQRDAQSFLDAVRVDGASPGTADQLGASLEQLDAAVAAVQLAQKWAMTGVPIVGGPLPALLSELADNAALLDRVEELGSVHRAAAEHLGRAGITADVSTAAALLHVVDEVPVARQVHLLEQAGARLAAFHTLIRDLAAAPRACAELSAVLTAVSTRDRQAYADAVDQVDRARREQAAHRRVRELLGPLQVVHPALARMIGGTAHDEAWDSRLAHVSDAWAWAKARKFVQRQRNAERERELVAEFSRLDLQLDLVTKRLVAVQATLAMLDRMSDAHARALNGYREHMNKIGAGTGRKTEAFRKAARASMRKAQDAVPAWVVPLPTLLENLEPRRDSFDVVIVDEASQVGIEHLYLLWLAPRVIIVGDDKQCTPGPGRLGDLDWLFDQNAALMPDVDHDIRLNFTQKSNLYGVLTARAGRDAVVRLREHFRCMPEIISWSSQMFYPDNSGKPGLIPLRERRADDLEPLQVVPVEDAYTEGSDQRRRNPPEAKAIVETLVECLRDPRYEGKSFGVVVLSGSGQVRLLEHEINAAISTEERASRQIRVGIPSDFQGDERDVVILSMVVAQRPQAAIAENFRQSYNVAASRARDQMWLFTSVELGELRPADLRASLLGYMLDPPSTFGASPELDDVPADDPCEPFDSLFEQRVFREIKKRGYHVVPQYPVGERRLDLVVSGSGGRIAVECDGHRWHTSVDDQANDARRDRDLARQRWQTVRLRESEFEFDKQRELRPLWDLLAARGIEPSA